MNVLEIWIGNKTDNELLGLVPDDKPERIYEIVRGYEKVHTTLTASGLDIGIIATDPIITRWDEPITIRNQKTRELFNYVEVQGGYGLEPIKEMPDG